LHEADQRRLGEKILAAVMRRPEHDWQKCSSEKTSNKRQPRLPRRFKKVSRKRPEATNQNHQYAFRRIDMIWSSNA
jgi:hypothetical protein